MNFEEIEKIHRRSARLRIADDELSKAVDAVKKAQETLRRADDELSKSVDAVKKAQETLKSVSLVYSLELLEMIKKERV